MIGVARLQWALKKELRALVVPWLACLAAIGAAAVLGRWWRGFAMPAYVLGAVALGGLSMGHEYSDRTLTLLLSHPVRRERLLLVKLGVLATLLGTLCGAASLFMLYATGLRSAGTHASEWAAGLILPALCGLLLAPWLTMLCRSAIAGTVFSLVIPGLLLVLGDLLGRLGDASRSAAGDLRMVVLWSGTLGFCALGGLLGWRTFMRLEAIEGRDPDVHLPQWLRRSPTLSGTPGLRKRHPTWLLVKKELRLQQMSFAVGALYLLAWVGVASIRHLAPDLLDAFNVLSIFYGGLISLLVGSLASAEERQMGTLQAQVLLPMATWKQWSIKVTVALGLALLLALGLPLVLASATPQLTAGSAHGPLAPTLFALPVTLLTVGALYVSSLCNSGLWALLMSLPATVGVVLFVRFMAQPVLWALNAATLPVLIFRGHAVMGNERLTVGAVAVAVLGGLLGVVLRLGLTNHRFADRPSGRILKQTLWIAAGLALGLTSMAVVAALYAASAPRLR